MVKIKEKWLSEEVTELKQVLKQYAKGESGNRLSSEYWEEPFSRSTKREEDPGVCHGDRAPEHPGVCHGDRAPEHPGVCHEDRAPEHLEVCHGDRAPVHSEVCHGNRVSEHLGVCHGERAREEGGVQQGHGKNREVTTRDQEAMEQEKTLEGPRLSGYTEGAGGGSRLELPPIPATMNPMELGDWLCLIGPILRDISSNSAKWWELTVAEAQRYYELWRVSTPVQRVKIQPKLPELLTTQAYLRTEQRGMGLLLRAMSDELKKVIIANRDLTSTHLIWLLLITFQPGGSGEKGQLLQTLTTVAPGTTPGEAATAVRHWRRCFQRAREIDASLPDGTLLVKGLEGVAKLVANVDTQAAFRLAQSRAELAVDSMPSETAVWQYSQVLLAEAETLQLAQSVSTLGGGTTGSAKVKAMTGPGMGGQASSSPTPAAGRVCRSWGIAIQAADMVVDASLNTRCYQTALKDVGCVRQKITGSRNVLSRTRVIPVPLGGVLVVALGKMTKGKEKEKEKQKRSNQPSQKEVQMPH